MPPAEMEGQSNNTGTGNAGGMLALISLAVLSLTLASRAMLVEVAGYNVAAILTMCGGGVVMHAAWVSYSNSSPFAPVWFAILTAGSLGVISWSSPGILADVANLPLGVALAQVLFLFGIVPISVSAAPLLRWLWDNKRQQPM